MKKPLLITVIVSLLAIAGGVGAFVLTRDSSDSTPVANTTQQESPDRIPDTTSEAPAEQTAATPSTDTTPAPTETSEQQEPATKPSSYVTLADYNSNQAAYASQKKVYFFHAPWCPICKAIDEDIRSDTSQIPGGTTFIKTDYDSNTALRQKYGVTYQYTFVQVDNNGNELKQWSATNLDKAIAGIQ